MRKILLLVSKDQSTPTRAVLERAVNSYAPLFASPIKILQRPTSTIQERLLYFRASAILHGNSSLGDILSFPTRTLPQFHVDPESVPLAAWNWFSAIESTSPPPPDWRNKQAEKLNKLLNHLTSLGYDETFVFGTGPSLMKSLTIDFRNKYRIVCNTICKSPQLWSHILPHIIVAGDALYHFSETQHAIEFRTALRHRLENSDCYFIYPSMFRSRVETEFSKMLDRCIGLPQSGIKDLKSCVNRRELPAIGNVLGLLLLPLACCLTKKIRLLGFDGRKPSDGTLFWKNAEAVNCQDLIEILKAEYPAFFSHFVPTENPDQYVKQVHGDELDVLMSNAEAEGYTFTLCYPSSSPALARRPIASP